MKIFLARHIKNVRFFNNNGFTLLEMLFAFSIFLLIVSFLPISFKYLFQDWQFDSDIQRMEWQVFNSQIKKEFRLSDHAAVSNERIILHKGGQKILYEKYGSNIRRRVDSKGHEIVLQHVDSVLFSREKGGIKMTVIDTFKKSYSVLMYSYIEMGEEHAP